MPKLIIAEKPSVATDIAAALGGFTKRGPYFERADLLVAAARGHLVSIDVSKEADPGFVLDRLPVIPKPFRLDAINSARGVLSNLRELIFRKDVDGLINACDAGREGELIFRLIVEHLKAHKPIERMWLQTMTTAGIRSAFERRRHDRELQPLAAAARCRAEADWLVGINATRALTKANFVAEGELVSAGRVQTPTLALVVDRELARIAFKPRDFYEVVATLEVDAGPWDCKWFDTQFVPQADEQARPDRLFDRTKAQAIAATCKGQPVTSVTDESKVVKRAPPKLFDLTSLQREANTTLGFSAARTLEIAQYLYETAKVLTYPRTDSSHLPEDYQGKVGDVMRKLPARYSALATNVLQSGWITPSHPVFDNSKISDHFAIIPTGKAPDGLSDDQAEIFHMVVQRFLAAFFPAAELRETRRVAVIAGHSFRATGSVLVRPGWMAVYGDKRRNEAAETMLPTLGPQEVARNVSVAVRSGKTTPPPRYTEATLLAAMESAGRLVDDDALAAAMKERGLGTPATRANVIEELLSPRKSYLLRAKKDLAPTQKALSLVQALRAVGLDILASPELTGQWESRLLDIEKGRDTREAFMRDAEKAVTDMVAKVRAKATPATGRAAAAGPVIGACHCGRGDLRESPKAWQCGACGLVIWKEIAHRKLQKSELNALRSKGQTAVLEGFTSNAGRTFSAALRVNGSKVELVFPG